MNMVGVDKDCRVCTPVYTYANSCPGTADAARGLRLALSETCSQERGLEAVHQRTGAPVHGSYAPAQFLRLMAEEPEVAHRVKLWQSLPSLIMAKWCCLKKGAPVSFSEASWTGLLDFRKLEWDPPTVSLLEASGFDPTTLPQLADIDGLRTARVCGSALERWPELADARLFLGIGDGAAASVGSGCDAGSGNVAVTIGTSAAARLVLDARALGLSPCRPGGCQNDSEGECAADSAAVHGSPRGRRSGGGAGMGMLAGEVAGVADRGGDDKGFQVPEGLWCYRLDRRRVVLGGALTDGGSVYQWMCETLGLRGEAERCSAMEEAAALPPAGHGVVILPFFSGERSPGYDDMARAAIMGVCRSTTRAELLRAGLESVCLRLATIVSLITSISTSASTSSYPHPSILKPSSSPLPAGCIASAIPDATDVAGRGGGCPSLVSAQPPCEAGGTPTTTTTTLSSPVCKEAAPSPQPPGPDEIAMASSSSGLLGRQGGGEGQWQCRPAVVASGAALSASPVWRQMLADVLGMRVLSSEVTEETQLGVAMVLSAALEEMEEEDTPGMHPSQKRGQIIEERGIGEKAGGVGNDCHTGQVCHPDASAHEAYRKALLAQGRAYSALQGWQGCADS